jgi:CheY-like chemotaxis protein
MDNERSVSPPRVLVIENDRVIRQMLRFSLKEAGFHITETTTSADVLDLLEGSTRPGGTT